MENFRIGGTEFLKIYAKTDVGRVRSINQDCYDFCVVSENLAWAVVCDGMGGESFGEVASSIAKNTVKENFENFFTLNKNDYTNESIRKIILNSTIEANENIFNKSKEENFSNMGTTIVIAVVFKKTLHIAHVGDSRAYMLSANKIIQLTSDHSFVQEMVKSGKITPQEAKTSSQKNIITRALGVESSVSVDYENFILNDGDKVFLCTDGLTNYIDGDDFFDYFLEYREENIPEVLVKGANELGGNDNITVLLISNFKS